MAAERSKGHKAASAPTSPVRGLDTAMHVSPVHQAVPGKPPRLIAFAVNNSRETMAAFTWATANLVRADDRLMLVHVHDRASKDAGLKLLQTFEDKCLRRNLPCTSVNVQNSNAASAIAQVCRSYPVDLCVMGSRGFGPIRRALMGSVSSSTAQQSDCPVMVIKRPKDAAGAFLTVMPRRVFFHVDGTQQARRALVWAEQYMLQGDLDEVVLVHITKGPGKFSQEDELDRVHGEMLLDTCHKRLTALGIKTVIKMRETGPAAETLLRVAAENSCDVLVAGLGDGKPVFGECLAMYSLHNAPFPVVCVGLDRRRRDLEEEAHAPLTEVPAGGEEGGGSMNRLERSRSLIMDLEWLLTEESHAVKSPQTPFLSSPRDDGGMDGGLACVVEVPKEWDRVTKARKTCDLHTMDDIFMGLNTESDAPAALVGMVRSVSLPELSACA